MQKLVKMRFTSLKFSFILLFCQYLLSEIEIFGISRKLFLLGFIAFI